VRWPNLVIKVIGMKSNIEYTAQILDKFESCEQSQLSFVELWNSFVLQEDSNEFVFHFRLLVENGLISRHDMISSPISSLGLHYSSPSDITIFDAQLRLTQQGHDFAKALNNREVLAKLKDGFKEAPFKVIFDGSQQLPTHFFKKKIDSLTAE